MKFRSAFALTLGLALAAGASAVTIGFNPRTGDVWVDTQLRDMNQYGVDDRDFFIDELVDNFGAPRYLVTELLTTRHWAPGDVYYACALAYRAHRPCGDVVHLYEHDHGHGWGEIAQRMGVAPGSPAFHALKGDVGKSNGHYKQHGHGSGNSGDQVDGQGDSRDDSPGNSEDRGHGQGKGKHKKGDGR